MSATGARVLVEFASADAMVRALELLREHRYRKLETYTPYPIRGVAERLRLPEPWLPRLVFAGGVAGALLGYGIQWFANVQDYPLNVGGRPLHSVPAFIPATFEAAVLGAALVAFLGFFFLVGLPALWHPVFEVDRFEGVSDDRFWVSIDGLRHPGDVRDIQGVLGELAPLRVILSEPEP